MGNKEQDFDIGVEGGQVVLTTFENGRKKVEYYLRVSAAQQLVHELLSAILRLEEAPPPATSAASATSKGASGDGPVT